MKLKYRIPGGLTYRPYLLELIEENHCLISGTTGSGKSVLENGIIYSLLCTKYPGKTASNTGCKMVFIDPKKVELDIYKNLPHCLYYADNIPDIEKTLYCIRQIVDNRLYTMKKAGCRKSKECPIYVFIDELVDIVTSSRSKQIIELIKDIISISRCVNIFFCILTQAPNRKILKPEIVLNCNCKVALRCNSPIESRQIIDTNEAVDLPEHGLAIVQNNIDRYMIKIPFYNDMQLEDIAHYWTKQNRILRTIFHL